MGIADRRRLSILEHLHLETGIHADIETGACAMEFVSYIASEPWSDRPLCVCPILGAFMRAWNDGLPDDERDGVLKPIIPLLIGTRSSDTLSERRALMAADWLVHVHAPTWQRVAGTT